MDFVVREMQSSSGFYVSSLNAQDALGEEGGNYIWNEKRLRAIVKTFKSEVPGKTTEYSSVPGSDKVLPTGLWLQNVSKKERQRVWQKRINNPPVKDDKLLLSWNAYLLSSMVELLNVADKKQYRKAAEALYINIKEQTKSGLSRRGQGSAQRYLEDYAFVANALYQWNKLQKNDIDQKLIRSLVMEAVTLFADSNGWKMTDKTIIPMPTSQKSIKEGNLPSAEVVLLTLFLDLKIDHSKVKKIIARISQQVDAQVVNNPLEYSGLIIFRQKYNLDL